MRFTLDVLVHRGPVVEARHRLECAVSDASGCWVAGTADPHAVTMFRSAAKPFQLLPLIERGHADRWGFGTEALAVMCASHTGSAYHRTLVGDVLTRIGARVSDLACGTHDPADPEALAEIAADPARRSPLHHNCSGKHAGMLAMCVAEGWPLAGYTRAEHPLQQLLLTTVSEIGEVPRDRVLTAVDGCSVVVFGLSLHAMARGYARLATARDTGDARERALARIRNAMTAFPVAVEGAGRLSTDLMNAARGILVAKGGAEGLQLIGVPQPGLGIALKCEDGASRPLGPAAVAVLDRLGLMDESLRSALEPHRRPVVLNAAGIVTGHLEVAIHETAIA